MTRTAFTLALHRLNTEISAALKRGDQRTLQDIHAIATWVAHQWPTCQHRALQARAAAVLRYLAADHA